jgi:cyclopropane fatty-acyl-phospholipid synthase-like methyltransferase
MIDRVTEPELMTNLEQCNQYYRGWREPLFGLLLDIAPDLKGKVADLGSGPGQFLKLFRDNYPNAVFDGIDGSSTMHTIAKNHIKDMTRINLILENIENINKQYDFIVSINTLHHIHDPKIFWEAIQRMSHNDTKILVLDLVRPNSNNEIDTIIQKTVKNFNDDLFILDYKNSLKAAFSQKELEEQVKDLNYTIQILPSVPKLAVIKNYE